MSTNRFARRLLEWFDEHGRHDLPWQHPRSAYRTWVSEIMLQQTQVTTVIPYFQRFMETFPGIEDLAAASEDRVMELWSGLGYYSRARNLHRAARQIVERHDGRFPEAFDDVLALPGIGRSTAGAILAQAFDRRFAILDGNVKRVLARQYAVPGWPGRTAVSNRLWEISEELTPSGRVADYTQAIMDLGATLCRRGRPDCEGCPVSGTCQARAEDRVAEFPGSRPRRRIPERESWMAIVTDGQGVLLERRPPAGIWGGLWCFPEFRSEDALQEWLADQGIDADAAEPREPLTHTFTHFRLTVRPLRISATGTATGIRDNDSRIWYRGDESLGLAAPVKRIRGELIAPPTD